MMDVKKIREDFPIYQNEPALVYLDSAASALKVKPVIEAIDHYYETLGVNVHRGTYDLTYEATELYEKARQKVAAFIHAETDEIIFTRGTTSSLNTIALAYRDLLKPGDEIITSELEHHSSLLPWMMAAQKTKAELKYIPLTKTGRITVESFKKVLTDRTKIVAITYISNVLGYQTPIKEIIALAHEKGAIVILDAAQAASHIAIDVKDLNVDYLAFSGHKMFGPTGIGVLYGKKALLNQLEPVEYGGEMADQVFQTHATWKETPIKFEAGTPIISGAIGLAAAVDYIQTHNLEQMQAYTLKLRDKIVNDLKAIEGITIYNPDAEIATITFNVDGVHPHDIATFLDQDKISVRAGHHCAQLVSHFLNVQSTLRVSLHIYNDERDGNLLVESIRRAVAFFSGFTKESL
ncbi:MAG: SufS family cysteine desulfurase [Acholeplasmataceae bacterium]|nr:SufS family cysteine desulfurase [Acholeplasmataceae bacterium]